jgi:LDH2 family malate/lactate/ureidoglycolate dehydrogenase
MGAFLIANFGIPEFLRSIPGALSGGAVLGQCESKKDAKSWGQRMIAINPDALVDNFPSKVDSIIATVKESGDNIRIPGQRFARTALEQKDSGVMPIPESIWKSLQNTAKHGLTK